VLLGQPRPGLDEELINEEPVCRFFFFFLDFDISVLSPSWFF
jgi:hypothetical protein